MTMIAAPPPFVKFDSANVAHRDRFGTGVFLDESTVPTVNESWFNTPFRPTFPVEPVTTPTLAIKGILYDVQTSTGDDGEEVVRVSSHADPAGVYDVSRGADGLVKCDCPDYVFRHEETAGMCKHGAACVAAGLLDAPAPVPVAEPVDPWAVESDPADWPADTDADVWSTTEADPDGIPAAVEFIRVTEGLSAGEFRRDGRDWARIADGRLLTGATADSLYLCGRVAIPSKAPSGPVAYEEVVPLPKPAPAPAPAPKPIAKPIAASGRRGPSAEDVAFEAGRTAALESRHGDVQPVGRLTETERTAWHAGLAVGLAEVEAGVADAIAQAGWDRLADEDGPPAWLDEPGERNEARLASPAAVAMD